MKAFALLIGALALCLVLMEVAVRAFVPVRNVGPSFSTYDPVYGKRLKSSFTAVRITPEFEMTFSTNAQGFRSRALPAEHPRPILFVGDSFTMGYGVSDGEEFPALVARHLAASGIPVVNAGIGDTGNGRALRFLRNEGAELRPRLIVLQLAENDFADNLREGFFKLDPVSGDLVDVGAPAPGAMHRIQAWIEAVPGLPYSHLVGLAREVAGQMWRSTGPSTGRGRQGDALMARLIDEILALAERERWPVLVLTAGLSEARLAAVGEICGRHGVDLIAIPAKAASPDLYYAVDGHWNPRGHAYAAVAIVGWMRENRGVWNAQAPSS